MSGEQNIAEYENNRVTFCNYCGWTGKPVASVVEAKRLGIEHAEKCEAWKANARKILGVELENIPGVPEGYELVHASRQPEFGEYYLDIWGKVQVWVGLTPSDRYCVILKRIPKPKKRVITAEFIAPENACTGIYPIITAEFHLRDGARETVSAIRTEERDS